MKEFVAATSFTEFGLLSCSGRGVCVKSKCVCGADSRGRAGESSVFDLPVGQISVYSDEMVSFRSNVPMNGAAAAMLRMTVPVNCFKHGVWMGLRCKSVHAVRCSDICINV
jgi:hypothetical protein